MEKKSLIFGWARDLQSDATDMQTAVRKCPNVKPFTHEYKAFLYLIKNTEAQK